MPQPAACSANCVGGVRSQLINQNTNVHKKINQSYLVAMQRVAEVPSVVATASRQCKQNTLILILTRYKAMKKSTLAFLTTVIAFAPLTAFAQDTQTSIQNNANSASAVGDANFIQQEGIQTNIQDQLDLGAYGVPDAQTSVQNNANEAAGIGNYNVIDQDATQTNIQDQVDLNQYLPQGYGY